ncbi:hypothetical protein [Aminobacter sp. HY435]|uniref:hypothetical protein n=1 Tax=Aminobacter sp. HY435 TaxID=2970917 RepID=UPI0022B949B1|nr:hypothetical protein [Aminobacter sp. HY435]
MHKHILLLAIASFLTLQMFAQSAIGLEIGSLEAPDATMPAHFDTPRACLVKGDVVDGDLEKLQAFIGTRKAGNVQLRCDIVYLYSNGGNFSEAVKIMDYFFSSMIATSVEAGASCYSACAIMWLGGSVPGGHNLDNPHAYRRLDPSGIVGFHAPYVFLSDGNYTNYDVMVNGTLSFKVAQELLVRFQDHRIPMWFAAKLLYPDPENFYTIDTIEDANLVGATIHTKTKNKALESIYSLGNICFNLSHWGKNRSANADSNKTFSNNSSSFSSSEDYVRFLSEATITGVSTKYVYGLSSFLSTTNFAAQLRNFVEENSNEIVGLADAASQTPKSLFRFWQMMSERLGPDFDVIAPSFLRWKANDWSKDYSYLFPSPGVVGAHDENIRDRPEWCAITLPSEEDEDMPAGFYAVGTEFDPTQELVRLPAALLALPADTKLVNIEDKLSLLESTNAKTYPKPRWCAQAASETERRICEDPQLSRLDIEFEGKFALKKATAKDAATSVAREMMKLRNKCGRNADCIKSAYATTIYRLNRM